VFGTGGDEGNSLIPSIGKMSLCRVATTTLDYVVEQIGRCDFLKMDCEGDELAILEHATEATVRKIGYIAMEYHKNLPLIETILKRHGFHMRVEGGGMGIYMHPAAISEGLCLAWCMRATNQTLWG
jgi:hypothetical protein